MNHKTISGILLSLFIFLTGNSLLAQNKTHIVVQGETLYGIARQYEIHISELLIANQQIEDNIIHIGDIINIPYTKTPNISVNLQTKTEQNPKTENVTNTHPFDTKKVIENNKFPMIEHIVKEKETLYAISKLYGVTIDDIKAWNHLDNSDIKIGSVLLIRKQNAGESLASSSENKVVKKENETELPKSIETKTEDKKTSEIIPLIPTTETPKSIETPQTTKASGPQRELEQKFIEDIKSGKTAHTTNATIAWIPTTSDNKNFYALHKTAPIGSTIKVSNLVNKRVVFVKVLGKLPETADNNNVTMRMSLAAKNALLLNGDKAFVGVTYYE